MKRWIVGATFILGTAAAPVIPEQVDMAYACNCTIFDTPTGQLENAMYYQAENGTFYARNNDRQFVVQKPPRHFTRAQVVRYETRVYYRDGTQATLTKTQYESLAEKDGARSNPTRTHYRSLIEPALAEAASFDAATGATNTTGTSLTYPHTVGSGSDRLLVTAGYTLTDVVSSVLYNGTNQTFIAKTSYLGGARVGSALYYQLAPTTGTNNVVINTSSSVFIDSETNSYSGFNQSGQPDASNTNSQTSVTSHTCTLTTVADNSWVIMSNGNASGALSGGSGTTVRTTDASTATALGDSNGPKTPAGSVTLTMTTAGSASQSASVCASFSPAASAVAPSIESDLILFE